MKNGICKVNYATELRQAYTKGFMAYMAENPACFDPKKPAKEGMREITELVKIRMTNPQLCGQGRVTARVLSIPPDGLGGSPYSVSKTSSRMKAPRCLASTT